MAARIEASLNREDVVIEPRAMTPARRARILAKHNHCCAYPECSEAVGLEIDHAIALALGGRDHEDNLEPLCPTHHRQKTARDVKLIAKAKRQAKLTAPKVRKASGFRGWRKMDGTIVWRGDR